jgi:hypothetical protein
VRWLTPRVETWQLVCAIACLTLVVVEYFVVFVDRDDTFRIEGAQAYEVSEFSEGGTVSHAFLMRGEGFRSIAVRLSSTARTRTELAWTLWRGQPDTPDEMTRAAVGVETVDVRPGPQWITIEVPRDSSSNNRWYTIELKSNDATAKAPGSATLLGPRVSVMASRDNPDRGGVLWVNNVRQPGSLFLRASRRGMTLYRRFQTEVEPKLPPFAQSAPVQYAIVALLHWAFIVFAFAVVGDGHKAARAGQP